LAAPPYSHVSRTGSLRSSAASSALTAHFRKANVSELTPAKLAAFFQRGDVGRKSFNNRRGPVSAFLKYCLLQDWIAANPIEKAPHFRGGVAACFSTHLIRRPTRVAVSCPDVCR
jgi:hypothetical protein